MTNIQLPPDRRKKWTVEQFDRLSDLGAFKDRKIELLEGECIEQTPQTETHVRGVSLMQTKLIQFFGQGYVVRSQAPLRLANSKPERCERRPV